MSRKCYLLTCDESSSRTQFSKNILEKVGFSVEMFLAIPHKNKVISNKNSMMEIYSRISHGNDEWVYVFEDDVNLLEDITLEEIIKYESISSIFFYLGLCVYDSNNFTTNDIKISNNSVTIVKGGIRGLHAIGLSKKGAHELLHYSCASNEIFMDVCLENFSLTYPANVVRYDLVSHLDDSHRGVFFQDRKQFPTTMI